MAQYTPLIVRLATVKDPRHKDHIVYLLPEVLLIVYASILSGYTQWKSMASFAENNADWFRQFYPYRWGFPSHHTIATICSLIDPDAFRQLFLDWMEDVIAEINAHKMGPFPEGHQPVIALDGKALRGSRASKHKKMVHIVSAYCTELRLVLGIEPVDKKSNEITAIPKILDKLVLEGSLVTIDAIGCQTDICQKTLDKKADYLLCAKENQPTLCHNIEAVFKEYLDQHPTDPEPEDNPPFLLKPSKKTVIV